MLIRIREQIERGMLTETEQQHRLNHLAAICDRLDNRVPKRKADAQSGRASLQPKAKKAKPGTKSSAKLPNIWTAQASTMLDKLLRADMEHGSLFKDPVTEKIAPGYFDIIKDPMDLKTVSSKLQAGKYMHPDDLVQDIDLIFANCALYNPKGTPEALIGEKVALAWSQIWSKSPLSGLSQKGVSRSPATALNGRRSQSGQSASVARCQAEIVSDGPTRPQPFDTARASSSLWEPGLPPAKTLDTTPAVAANLCRTKPIGAQMLPSKSAEHAPYPAWRRDSLAEALGMFAEEQLEMVIPLLLSHGPLPGSEEDEFELDLETLSLEQVWALDKFAQENSGGAYNPEGDSAGA